MNVYTFFEPVNNISNQLHLIEICKKSWMKYGWNFIILNESNAKIHPFYNLYVENIRKLPSVNPENYDYYCFIRWLAMASVDGGLMIDYDVMNLGFYEGNLLKDSSISTTKINILEGHTPCVVYGTIEQYQDICTRFSELCDNENCITTINGNAHTSDMLMLASGLIDFNHCNLVKSYPNITQLTHCSYEATNGKKKEIMKNLESL